MMTRLCIRVQENPGGDPTGRTQPGDVVCMVDDDHKFNYAEMNNGHYRIIDLPGVPQEKLAYLLEPKVEVILGGVEPEERPLARRAVKIDLAAFPAKQKVATEADIAAVVSGKVF